MRQQYRVIRKSTGIDAVLDQLTLTIVNADRLENAAPPQHDGYAKRGYGTTLPGHAVRWLNTCVGTAFDVGSVGPSKMLH